MVGAVRRRLLDLFKALVEGQVVAYRVFPAVRGRFEVREMLTETNELLLPFCIEMSIMIYYFSDKKERDSY